MLASTNRDAIASTLEHTSQQRQILANSDDLSLQFQFSSLRRRAEIMHRQNPTHASVDPEPWPPDGLQRQRSAEVVDHRLRAAVEVAGAVAVEACYYEGVCRFSCGLGEPGEGFEFAACDFVLDELGCYAFVVRLADFQDGVDVLFWGHLV